MPVPSGLSVLTHGMVLRAGGSTPFSHSCGAQAFWGRWVLEDSQLHSLTWLTAHLLNFSTASMQDQPTSSTQTPCLTPSASFNGICN